MNRSGWTVLAVAGLVRIWAAADARDAPFWRIPIVDESAYLDLARGLLSGTPPPHGAWYVSPGYAYVLALVLSLGGGPVAAKVLNLAAGAASAWCVHRLARSVAGERAALAAGLVWAVLPVALLQELLVLKTSLATLCLLAGVLAIQSNVQTSTSPARRWILAGLALGSAVLLRGELSVLVLAMAAAGLVAHARGWEGAPARRSLAAFLVVAFLPLAIPTWQNVRWRGDFVLGAWGGGTNLYIGNHPEADGGYLPLRSDRSDPAQEETDAVALAERARGRPLRPSAVSRYWLGRAFEWWRDEPVAALALTLRKWALLWGPRELADVLSTSLAGRWVALLRLPLAGPTLLLPAALAGLWIARRRMRSLWPLYAALAGAQLSIVPFFLFERFRLHLIALALPFAMLAAERASRLARLRQYRRLAAGLAATALCGVLLALPRVPRDETVLRVNLGEMFFVAGRYDEALQEFEAVRAESPDAWRVDINVANTEAARGRTEAALAALARVLPRLHAEVDRTGLAATEELLYCHELAGDLEVERGRLDLAARHYEAALAFAAGAQAPALRAKLAAARDGGAPGSP